MRSSEEEKMKMNLQAVGVTAIMLVLLCAGESAGARSYLAYLVFAVGPVVKK
jgi:hypothetical protein